MPIPLREGEPTGAVMLSNLPKSRQVEDVHYVGLVTLFKELLYVSVGASKKKKNVYSSTIANGKNGNNLRVHQQEKA